MKRAMKFLNAALLCSMLTLAQAASADNAMLPAGMTELTVSAVAFEMPVIETLADTADTLAASASAEIVAAIRADLDERLTSTRYLTVVASATSDRGRTY